MKTNVIILGVLAYVHAICMLTFYFHVAILLGYLPRYNQPDPQTLSIYSFYEPIISITGNIALFAFPLSIILIFVYLIIERKNISWRAVSFNLIGFSIAVSIFFSGIMEWFAD
jgi:hypothetical protein